jgi:hypothetical protein
MDESKSMSAKICLAKHAIDQRWIGEQIIAKVLFRRSSEAIGWPAEKLQRTSGDKTS